MRGATGAVSPVESGIGTAQVTFDVFQHAGRFGIRLSRGEEKNSVRTVRRSRARRNNGRHVMSDQQQLSTILCAGSRNANLKYLTLRGQED
jgi:hypothetical protein